MNTRNRLYQSLIFALLCAGGAEAATFNITTTVDNIDEFDGFCSLREAISNANDNAMPSPIAGECPQGAANDTDTIVLVAGATYLLDEAFSAGLPDGSWGDLDIVGSGDLNPHLAITVANGGSATVRQTLVGQRVFSLSGVFVSMQNLTIRNGSETAGGGLLLSNSNLTATGLTVMSNIAEVGGGFYVEQSDLSLSNSQVILNTANGLIGGGGLYVTGGSSDVLLSNTQLRVNTAPAGGGLYQDDGDLSLINQSSVNLNTANSTHGGGLYVTNTNLIAEDVSFDGNNANQDGGAYYGDGPVDVTLSRCTMVNNNAVRGGAAAAGGTGRITVASCRVQGNSSGGDGGAMYGPFIGAIGSTFEDNESALGDGGAIYAGTGLIVETSEFINNRADDGGAIRAQIVSITDSSLIDNSAGSHGGGIYSNNLIAATGLRAIDNTAGGNGGGIWLMNANGGEESSIRRSLFKSNHAGNSGKGGGLWLDNIVTLANSTITLNSANEGGGLYIDQGASVSATNLTLVGHLTGQDLHSYGGLTLQNSIIATPGQPDCSGVLDNLIVSLGNNIADDNSCLGIGNGPSDMPSTEPLLDVLGSYGTGLETYALTPMSPALNGGNNTACANAMVDGVDQRGANRPFGPACDIGAHEQGAFAPADLFADSFE